MRVLVAHTENERLEHVVTAVKGNFPGSVSLFETQDAVLQQIITVSPDLLLAGFASLELCRQLKSDPATASIPVLLTTGHVPDPVKKLNALEAGADAVILMPAGEGELIARIHARQRFLKLMPQSENIQSGDDKQHLPNQGLRDNYEKAMFDAALAAKSFDAISDAILLIDRENCIVRFNSAAGKLYRDDQNGILGRPYHTVIYQSAEPVADCPVVHVRHHLSDQSSRIKVRQSWYRVNACPILDKTGMLEYCIVVISDITQKMLALEELQKSEARFRHLTDALRESEERYELALQATHDGIWDWNMETGSEYFSPRWREIMGYNPGDPELLHPTESWKARIHPDDREMVVHLRNSMTPEKNNYYAEYRLLKRTGEYGWLRSTGKTFYNEQGKPARMVGSILDISDRKRSEVALRESEEEIRRQNERLNAIISAVPDLIFVIDRDGNYLEFFTSEPEKLLIKPSELIGNNLRNAFNNEMTGLFLAAIEEVISTGRLKSIDYTISLPASDSTSFEARIAPLDREKVLIISRDVTQNVRKDFQIRKLSLAVEQSPVCIVITDLNAVIEYVNPAFVATTGYEEHELTGFNVSKIKSGQTDRSVFEELWKTITSGIPWQGEWINRKKDGTLYWDSVLITPIHNDAGDVISYLGLQQDITERKKAENELIAAKERAEESDMLKTAFLNNMSHEVRTPLNAIMGFSELLAAADRDEQEYFARIIKKSSDQLLSFFEDTLYLSRLQTEKVPVTPTDFKPSELLFEVSQMFNMSVVNDQVSLDIHSPAELREVRIRSDEAKIRQVLSHLTSNAVKYTREGRIEIGFHTEGQTIEFYVSDTGIGISEGEKQLIFENFYRGKKPVADAIRGTGVGLNISRELVDMMGGTIRLQSEAGKGSRFSFTVPFETPEVPRENTLAGPAAKELKELHVLIAEDELINFRLIDYMIRDKVRLTDHAFNGMEAVRMVRQNRYDLVLMDINMPKMGGLEATRIIKGLFPELPVIAHSAYALPEDRTRALEAGCDDFIAKPAKKDNIFEILTRYFGLS